ncbi:MAG: hypothetical protein AVDCRST_MAG45-2600 [uncultured Solirubrobacterales bacterium]|uniref:DUF86 domain-containing protein n=1 Tax=uncultured Solirubrobacterales bacterium TaxID=768556 RepID=A0A6J4TG97_9ACTN|nr:MAG: hypothetical protein AVDCRST_MAG45-2600 [uncultured Solirubrobacterales bacterium]
MVDGERLGARLERLERLIEQLEATADAGLEAYLADESLRLLTERRLQLAIQACIDAGAQLVSELSSRSPADYADVFSSLADGGFLERDLARSLGEAAGQRNLLVHDYLDIDDRRVFASLSRLDDLREFATVVQHLADEG